MKRISAFSIVIVPVKHTVHLLFCVYALSFATVVAADDAPGAARSATMEQSAAPYLETIPPPPESEAAPSAAISDNDDSNVVDAHQPVDASDGLNVDELVAIALRHHPTIRQAQAAVEKAKGLQYQSGRKFNPTVGYVASEVGNEGRLGQQGVYVGQTFVRGNKLNLNQQIYGWEVDRMNHSTRLQSLRIARQVRSRYFELVYSRRREQVLNRLLTVSHKNVSMAQVRYDADEVSQSQVLQAKLESQQLQLSIRQTIIKSQTAERMLANAMGLLEYDVTKNVSPPTDPPLKLNRDSVWHEVNSTSPELSMARSRISKAEWSIRRAKVEPIGNVDTQLSLQFDDSTNYTVAGIQVGVPIPVHDNNLGNIQSARADYVRACNEEKRLRLRLQERFLVAFSEYEQALESRSACAEQMIPIAKKI